MTNFYTWLESRQVKIEKEWFPIGDMGKKGYSGLRLFWKLLTPEYLSVPHMVKEFEGTAKKESQEMASFLSRSYPIKGVSWGYESFEMDSEMSCVLHLMSEIGEEDVANLNNVLQSKGFKGVGLKG